MKPSMTSGPDRSSPTGLVYLYGYYGAGNVGDELLLQVLLDELPARGLARDFVVRSVAGPVSRSAVGATVSESDLDRVLLGPRTTVGRLLLLPRYLAGTWRMLGRCTAVVFGGGTLFGGGVSLAAVGMQWLLVRCALLRSRAVFAVGVGVNAPGTGLRRWLLRDLLRRMTVLAVRDAGSVALLRALDPGMRVEATGDLVFSRPSSRNGTVQGDGVMFTVAGPHLGAADGATHVRVVGAFAAAASGAVRGGSPVRLLAFQHGPGVDGDAAALRSIAHAAGLAAEHVVALEPATPAVDAAYAGVGLVVGMRFHSLVLAAQRGIPFVGVVHDAKVRELCREFGMPVVELEDLDAERLTGAMRKARRRRVAPETLGELHFRATRNLVLLEGHWPGPGRGGLGP